MKKLFAILLALLMLFTLAACGKEQPNNSDDNKETHAVETPINTPNGDDADGTHDAAYVAIHDAQGELAQENENVYAVGSLLEYQSSMKDQYHFHQDAYNEVGTAAGTAIAQIYAQ